MIRFSVWNASLHLLAQRSLFGEGCLLGAGRLFLFEYIIIHVNVIQYYT